MVELICIRVYLITLI